MILIIGGGMVLSACSSDGGGEGGGSAPAAPTQPTPEDGQTGYSVSGLSGSTTYFWKVVASDDNGGTTESAVYSFTTQ